MSLFNPNLSEESNIDKICVTILLLKYNFENQFNNKLETILSLGYSIRDQFEFLIKHIQGPKQIFPSFMD